MRIGVFGKGRLGSALAAEAGPDLLWQVGREAPPAVVVDAAIDASAATAVPGRLEWALATGSNLLIGTTGWTLPDLADRIGDRIGVIVAPNFSLTVALYARLSLVLARYAALSEDCDPYLVEHHHARKHDAPSGTAKQLAATLLKGCPRKTEWVLPAAGRPVEAHQLNVSSIRAGHTYSSHTVGLDSPGEVVELHHAARSARPYAAGALVAARWLQGRKGLFSMDQVAAEVLDPLFQEIHP